MASAEMTIIAGAASLWGYVSMGASSGDQPFLDLASEERRRSFRRLIMIGIAGAVSVLVIAVTITAAYLMSIDDTAVIDLTVTNRSTTTVTDAGFEDPYNMRVISLHTSVPPGATRTIHVRYNVNDCPGAFSYDQAGTTWRVPLGGLAPFDSSYSVTIGTGVVGATCDARGQPTTAFSQVPTTQPLN